MERIIEINFEYMEDIKSAAKRMLELAKTENCIVIGTFNNVLLTTKGMNSVEDILNYRKNKLKERNEKYKKSYQHIYDEEMAKHKQILIEKISNIAIEEFRNLDLNNVKEVVAWIDKLTSWGTSNFKNNFEVLNKLYANGYLPLSKYFKNSNSFNETNKYKTVMEYISNCDDFEEAGIYLISRAMQDIEEFGCILDKDNCFTKIYLERLEKQKIKSKKL